ncbi:MAG: C4-dicarboxylate transporter DctA [Chitinophagaceae bacterium]|nr:C4-dicarboxylate transporter DctA [Chitinophagaceae bacterium]MDP1764602.1 C4-dicarboxylate transporter DctA [Sediminibacterium sp.]MDP1811108.1 C4-dicarboxylate transporter DctA [Sediminibacterium sp.]MDP3129444.1 C4-dicarboxylate transporter DctA [Sediminibacterium sp.]MDP3665812.1 C4-dicarboxylate transporter DctA [Sediminibacterium sp.]
MKYLKVLYVQVIIGITAGIVTGWLFPSFAPTAKLISEGFINMIKMVITPVIFLTIVLGITGAGSLKKVGRVGGKGLLYFEVVTTFALILGLVVANVIKPGAGIATNRLPNENLDKYTNAAKEMNWGEFFSHIIPTNIMDSFAKGDLLQVLFFGVLFSVAITKMGTGGAKLISVFENLNKAFFNVIHIVMKFSPIGAFGGMAYTIGKFGFGSLVLLGKLLLAYYITSFLFIFVVLNLIGRYYGFNIWKLLVYIKEELLIVLGASSSEAVLPNLMEKLEAAGCEKTVVGLIIPTGYSFNLDGTTIYLSMATIFLAQVFDIDLSLTQQLTIIGILLITSKGAAGVTGSGFIVLTSTLTILKVIPLEGLALLIGVDRFMSEGRALTNMIGNTIATVIIAKSEKAIDMSVYRRVVNRET